MLGTPKPHVSRPRPRPAPAQVFESDRQKGEAGAGEGTIMTRIITERTAHLKPGTPFLADYQIVDGMRTTNTSVARWAPSNAKKRVWI